MVDYIFNEKKYIESMINSKYVDENAPMKTIRLLSRYCHFVLGFNEKESYRYIIDYMDKNSIEFHEQRNMQKVKSCIKNSYKNGSWKNIDKVTITRSELNKILSLNDERQEKIAFVLLADVKYYAACSGLNRTASYLSISNVFQLARVPCPYKERSYFMNFLYKDRDDGSLAERTISRSIKDNKVKYKLNYVSYDNSDEIVLELDENNYKELAFTYLNWKDGGGYKPCKKCGRLFKTSKYGDQEYCKAHTPKPEPMVSKTITCIDCGEEIIIPSKNNKTCRCEECQLEKNRISKREVNKRYYNQHKKMEN